MAHITEEHLHHMARRHHATMQKLDGIKEKIASYTHRGLGTLEIAGGAWVGGVLEGRSGGGSLGPIPFNLGIGAAFLIAGYAGLAKEHSDHLTNVGNGFLGSYLAASGYAFGKRWKDTGKILGGGGHPYTQPYETGWPQPTP